MGKNKNKYDFEGSNLLAYIVKRFKTLLLISFIAAVITGICTLFIHNLYKSEMVLFPTSPVNVARTLVDYNYGYAKGEYLSVGEMEEVDPLLQVLNSNEIPTGLIRKFNLAEHYKINMSSKGANMKLYKKVESNVKINRTEYNSVDVQVWDEDPKIASEMAKEIVNLVDTVFFHMEKERVVKGYEIVKAEYDNLNNNLTLLQDSLTKIGKLGVLEFQYQTQEIIKAYYYALSSGKTDLANKIEKQIKILEEMGPRTVTMNNRIKYSIEQLAQLGVKLSVARVAMVNRVPHKYVVSKPGVADHKDYPKRMLIVLISAVSAFFVALFSFIIAENIKRITQ